MTKYKKIAFFFLKIIVLLLSYIYIVYRLKQVDFKQITFTDNRQIFFFFLTVVLMLINWSLEAKKWQFIVKDVQEISFLEAVKNIFVGIVMGLFTPNRVGEIGGRAVYLKKENKFKGAIAASLGSFAQMTVTVVGGIFGLAILLFLIKSFNFEHIRILGVLFILMGIFFLFLFFNIKKVLNLLRKINIISRFVEKLNFLSDFNSIQLVKIILLSLGRYIVFVFQFYLLLRFFNVQIDFFAAIAGIFAVFLLMNVLPNVVIADLGIRGSISMFVLGQFATNVQGILLASVFLWLINILIPAIIGQFIILRTKTSHIFN